MKVPVNKWIFQDKLRIVVSQHSLSSRTYAFWKSVKDQYEAFGSLFQPVTGRVPANFVQLQGNEVPMAGIFFAAGMDYQTMIITRRDVPREDMIPDDGLPWKDSCLTLFPNGTTVKPEFWE